MGNCCAPPITIAERGFLRRLERLEDTEPGQNELLRGSNDFILLQNFITEMGEPHPRYKDYHDRWKTAYERITGKELYPSTPTKKNETPQARRISPHGRHMYKALRL
jgi:hypothetical protein